MLYTDVKKYEDGKPVESPAELKRQRDEECRQAMEQLDKKYRNVHVHSIVTKTGTEEVCGLTGLCVRIIVYSCLVMSHCVLAS